MFRKRTVQSAAVRDNLTADWGSRMVTGKVVATMVLAACLAGCAEESPFGPGDSFSWNASRWTVSERPDLGQLQIVAVRPRVSGIGTAAVYRFDAGDPPSTVYAAAVQGWFLVHGQHCTATDPVPTAPQTYVFQYGCWVPTGGVIGR